ncbi:MerR family transcriptional regulator [Paenibacillus tarimensis]|uniref:MerR family transcriptional regulator n=1 Tax=Paenibacillus tarimensis TaxID=416012 RepID=UPI002E2015D8
MKVGRFAETNRLSIDAVRHYIDLGLIFPEKKGGQYVFDERCQEDLKLIFPIRKRFMRGKSKKSRRCRLFHQDNYSTAS